MTARSTYRKRRPRTDSGPDTKDRRATPQAVPPEVASAVAVAPEENKGSGYEYVVAFISVAAFLVTFSTILASHALYAYAKGYANAFDLEPEDLGSNQTALLGQAGGVLVAYSHITLPVIGIGLLAVHYVSRRIVAVRHRGRPERLDSRVVATSTGTVLIVFGGTLLIAVVLFVLDHTLQKEGNRVAIAVRLAAREHLDNDALADSRSPLGRLAVPAPVVGQLSIADQPWLTGPYDSLALYLGSNGGESVYVLTAFGPYGELVRVREGHAFLVPFDWAPPASRELVADAYPALHEILAVLNAARSSQHVVPFTMCADLNVLARQFANNRARHDAPAKARFGSTPAYAARSDVWTSTVNSGSSPDASSVASEVAEGFASVPELLSDEFTEVGIDSFSYGADTVFCVSVRTPVDVPCGGSSMITFVDK